MHDKPWIKSYPPGVRWDAEIPLTPVQQILEESASKWPNNPAVDFMGRKISYSELDDLANRAANGLQKLGVKCSCWSLSAQHASLPCRPVWGSQGRRHCR